MLNWALAALKEMAPYVPSPYLEIVLGVGVVLIAWATWMGFMRASYRLKDHALRIRTTRLKWLRQSLSKKSPSLKCPALLHELEFQLAYGYAYSEQEITFAAARFNPSQRLHDIRYGNQYAQFDAQHDRYEERKGSWWHWSVASRLRVSHWALFGLAALFVFGAVSLFLYPVAGIVLLVETLGGFIALFGEVRALGCAQRLCQLRASDVRPKKRWSSEEAEAAQPEA